MGEYTGAQGCAPSTDSLKKKKDYLLTYLRERNREEESMHESRGVEGEGEAD